MNSLDMQTFHGDCAQRLVEISDASVDLIVTSPPYADRRKSSYGGVTADRYVSWFLPKSAEFFRVLKPKGTFILNIKEKADKGERHTFVLELILALKKQGWLWTEEFIWHKRNCYPGKWPNRFRDAWERLLQFNKMRKFNMYQEKVMIPIGNWSQARLSNLSQADYYRQSADNRSGFGKKVVNWIGRDMVYPTNVLHLATECANREHSAAFPESLPEWFIKLFTTRGDCVLDPFMGSGTTLVAACRMNRRVIGVEINEEYFNLARKRIHNVQKNALKVTSLKN